MVADGLVTFWLQDITFHHDGAGLITAFQKSYVMMTSSNGNIFHVTGPLCGEFTGPGEFPTQRPVMWSFDVFFDLRLNKRLGKHREAGDLRCHHGHYYVNVMGIMLWATSIFNHNKVYLWRKIMLAEHPFSIIFQVLKQMGNFSFQWILNSKYVSIKGASWYTCQRVSLDIMVLQVQGH